MIKASLLSLALLHVCSIALAQDFVPEHMPGKTFRIQTLPDGSKEAAIIPLSEEGQKAREMMLKMQLARGAGQVSHILDQLEIDDVINLVNDELTEAQSADLKELLTQYRDGKAALDPSDKSNLAKLRVKYGMELNKLLLPEQINSTRIRGHIFHVLIGEGPVPQYLDLSRQQQSNITSKCEQLNVEITELAAEIELKTTKLKERITDVLTGSLSKEQREKLERLVKSRLDSYFKDHNLDSLSRQTQTTQPEEADRISRGSGRSLSERHR